MALYENELNKLNELLSDGVIDQEEYDAIVDLHTKKLPILTDDELWKLKKLLDAGIIDQEEYQRAVGAKHPTLDTSIDENGGGSFKQNKEYSKTTAYIVLSLAFVLLLFAIFSSLYGGY